MACENCNTNPDPYKIIAFKDPERGALLVCVSCYNVLTDNIKLGASAGIATDEIPGGIEIKHGLCNPDGSPKKYYSKTEIKKAANERGYTISGDTPKPYRVSWSGRQRRIDGVKPTER